jgi:2-phosphoglycolate phosphatase
MIRAVVFDLDGTFIDSTPAIVESYEHTCDVLGFARPPRDALVASIGHLLEDQFRKFTDHDPDECVRVYREHYAKIAVAQTSLLPGAREAVTVFQEAGLKLGVATSKKLQFAEMILESQGLCACFESRIGPDEVTNPKPAPDCLYASAEALGVALDDLVYVGDTVIDVRASKAAGVRCLTVTTGYDARETLEALEPEIVVDSLDEVVQHVLNEVHAAR